MATTNAAVKPTQRKRQALRTSSRTRSNSCFMEKCRPSESRFRNHQYVPRMKRQVLLHVAVIDQRVELDLDFGLLAVLGAHQVSTIAGRELTQAADGQHRIQHGHAISIR